jgi:hypothetical protein
MMSRRRRNRKEEATLLGRPDIPVVAQCTVVCIKCNSTLTLLQLSATGDCGYLIKAANCLLPQSNMTATS